MNYSKSLFLLLSTFVAASTQDQLKVSIYYEALCPDSIGFITRQWYPTYTKLNSLFETDLVPYGKAIQNVEDGKWKFQCQHGPSECYGNKIQACALEQNIDFSRKMAYVNCLMRSSNPSKAGKECAEKIGVSWENVGTCASSAQGDDYLAQMGDRTHSLEPNPSFIPTIVFNGRFDQTLQDRSLREFKRVVCEFLNNPPECS